MPARLLWTPQALEDLHDIYVTIGLESPEGAERVLDGLEARTQVLCSFPKIGPRRTEIAPTARMIVEGFYLILYELHPDLGDVPVDHIEIVRVVDGRRELSRLF